MTKSRGILPFRPRRPWLAWEHALLRDLYPHVETEVIAWFLDWTTSRIHQVAARAHLKKTRQMIAETARERTARPDHGSVRTRFVQGCVSHNKGKTGWHAPGSEKGWFPKGHQRNDTAAPGAERIDKKDGYVLVKVADKGAFVSPWRLKHRVLWEQANGPIPKGMVLKCKGDKTNCALDNWEMFTRAENMQRNTVHNLPKELAQVVQLVGALKRKINGTRRKQQRQREHAGNTAGSPVRHAEIAEGQG